MLEKERKYFKNSQIFNDLALDIKEKKE